MLKMFLVDLTQRHGAVVHFLVSHHSVPKTHTRQLATKVSSIVQITTPKAHNNDEA